MTVNANIIGRKIIDMNGYVYETQHVYPKYVFVGNGEYILHRDYEVLPLNIENEIEDLAQVTQKIYFKHGLGVLENIVCKMLNRFDCIAEGEENPRQVCVFQKDAELEGVTQFGYKEKCSLSSRVKYG